MTRLPMAWLEGMLLRPQHLQHQDLYQDERLDAHLRALDPFHWGVSELVLNEQALSDHRIEIQRLGLVLPGGALVAFPGNADVEVREFAPGVERVSVHVGLRRLRPGEPGAAVDGGGLRAPRYRLSQASLADVQRGGAEQDIDVLVANLRVFLDGEDDQLAGCDSLKLLEIERTEELKHPYRVSPRYVPPLLRVQAWPALERELAKIAAQIAAKTRAVATLAGTQTQVDLPRLWMRYTLARMAPVLRHLLGTGSTAPFPLYTALVETAGALEAFAHDAAPELPSYDHRDLAACYRALIDRIDLSLQEALPDRFKEIPLRFDPEPSAYVAELAAEQVDPRNRFYLGIKAAIDSAELAELVEKHGKLSSARGVTMLVMLNRGGLRLEKLPAPPTEIVTRPGFDYFRVDPHGEQFARIRGDYSMGLNLGKLEQADVRLYVVSHGA